MWVQVALAYVVDLAIGDPKKIPHPVQLIGLLITFLEGKFLKDGLERERKRFLGVVLVVIVVGTAASVTWGIVKLSFLANTTFGYVVSVWLISTTIATRGLMDRAREIAVCLKNGNLKEAKEKVAGIVGRDTDKMKRRDVVRATIESVAENSVDGVIAPILYALIGGPALAMAYRAANTLDSMVGYKNEKYEDFGWAAARFDDILNYIPARLSVMILAIAALLCRKSAVKAIKVAIRDSKHHASPNSGLPEAAVAGANDLRLGGTNYYGGIPRKTNFIGDGKGALTHRNINEVIWLIFVASAITILLARAIIFAISYVKIAI
ncbi:MAG: adenosylcobinamide-phosphate synthase CbiB [Actinomycetota bacterium]